jgi:hypothetical protein
MVRADARTIITIQVYNKKDAYFLKNYQVIQRHICKGI